jgi:DNA-binding response OmpR family regulator
LIADDEPRYVRLMEANLMTEGYTVYKAYDGQQAVTLTAERQPDLVLLDIMMPVLDGFAACQRIREFSSVPIIMVTAKGEEHDRVRGLDFGADDYIVKPFSANELLARAQSYGGQIIQSRCAPGRIQSRQPARLTWPAEVFLNDRMVYLRPNTASCCSWRKTRYGAPIRAVAEGCMGG